MHVVHNPASPGAAAITFDELLKVDIRIGTIIAAEPFPEARNPSYRLLIDFGGSTGTRKSAAQITALYSPQELVGRQVMAVVNLPPRQIGPVRSEVLVLGVPDAAGRIILAQPERPAPNGARLA